LGIPYLFLHLMKKRTLLLLAGCSALLAAIIGILLYIQGGSSAFAASSKSDAPLQRREDNPVNYRAIDSTVRLLKDGDLALRTGADATSVMLRQMNLSNKTYSHCGIVMIENGYPFVYHSIGGEDNPNSKLRRDSAAVFFTPVSNERLGVARLDLSKEHIKKLRTIALRYWQAQVPFDLDFDLATDDKLYCAEFVYKAVQEAVSDTGFFRITHLLQRSYVGVDNLYEPRHATMICDVRYKL
jgi:hypothetical protein